MDELDKLLLDLQGTSVAPLDNPNYAASPKTSVVGAHLSDKTNSRLPPGRDELQCADRVNSQTEQGRVSSGGRRQPHAMMRQKVGDTNIVPVTEPDSNSHIRNHDDGRRPTSMTASVLQHSRFPSTNSTPSLKESPLSERVSSFRPSRTLSSSLLDTPQPETSYSTLSTGLLTSNVSLNTEIRSPLLTSNIHKVERVCSACGSAIIRGGVMLQGKYYHAEHFICSETSCRRNLRGVVCFERDNELFCKQHYHEKFSPQCAYCKEPIQDNRIIEALNQTFHRAHFFCSHCGKNFEADDTFQEYEGKAYCEDDFIMLFAKKCALCQEPILGEIISALTRQWHTHCFVCSEESCNIVLGAEGFYDYGGKPFCEFHYYQKGSNICNVCTKPIIGRCVVIGDRKYHPMHFTCGFCQTNLDGQGYKQRNGKPYCGNCYMKLFC
ncbi:hypothetical protein QVD99_002570 [Batrachochytrium dendrobatidis]|nr:hypothetical protein O5D80_006798 [Batrachochytrium dendrobatidis]KAK5670800.1 hypothetical protein QVD99_002570 [Batrachochytrium dendrobatidis]